MRERNIIQRAIELGRQKGFVTFDELNELLPSTTSAPENIEAVMAALGDEGIQIIENEEP
jgi:RNA polymerase primary sigma factor